MKSFILSKMHRRDVFRAAAAAAALAAGGTVSGRVSAAQPANNSNKRRPRYLANSREVQTFYRVNAYPVQREK